MSDLFSYASSRDHESLPLAERLRPKTLDDVVGQPQLLGPGRPLRRLIESDRLPSLILWGPPGTGKTSLATVIASHSKAEFVSYSAVAGSVKEIREILEFAAKRRDLYRKKTILFIDEIHRFNKAQQDTLLPGVEKGVITLIGATTENPSFEVNAALLSRCRVFVLQSLDELAIIQLLRRAKLLCFQELSCDEETLSLLARLSDGDARRALVTFGIAADLAEQKQITKKEVEAALGVRIVSHDKSGEQHYDLASALIKSMRGSDPDAAVYYLARLLEGGEDPLFVCRRMVIFAAEDVGNADPMALVVATQALQAVHAIGLPEGRIPMSMAATYLATAPKSKAAYNAIEAARAAVATYGMLSVPLSLRNAPTGLLRGLGYGAGYRDPHREGGYAEGVCYLPTELAGQRFYEPTAHGYEAKITRRLAWLRGESEEK
jgi:putative ATPase